MIKKTNIVILLSILLVSCSSKINKKNEEKGMGIKHKTENPNIPYIYENGYKNFEIKKIQTIQDKDTSTISELRFNAVFSAFYTKKLMFDKFGKWTNVIYLNNDRHPILIWENVKLFDTKNKVYSVATNGVESWEEMYASVIILDNNNNDCLTQTNSEKDSIIHYFSNELIKLDTNKKFYEEYWKIVK